MAHQIIKQPNGKFALWSTVIDDFLVEDATPAEIAQYEVECMKKQVINNTLRIVQRLKDGGKPYYQFTLTWEECKKRIKDRESDVLESCDFCGCVGYHKPMCLHVPTK